MKNAVSLIGAAALGAGLAYVTDTKLGKRRRALARDAVIHGVKVVRRGVDIAARDAAHRLKGLVAVGAGRLKHAYVSDDVLADHVRTEIGRVSSHPNVEVIVEEGCVTLLGPVVAREAAAVLKVAASVRGVQEIVNRMEPYVPRGDMQTQAPRLRRLDILQKHWAPATRLAVGSAGASMLVGAAKMPKAGRALFGVAGLALIASAATNLDFKRLLGFRTEGDTLLRKEFS